MKALVIRCLSTCHLGNLGGGGGGGGGVGRIRAECGIASFVFSSHGTLWQKI